MAHDIYSFGHEVQIALELSIMFNSLNVTNVSFWNDLFDDVDETSVSWPGTRCEEAKYDILQEVRSFIEWNDQPCALISLDI